MLTKNQEYFELDRVFARAERAEQTRAETALYIESVSTPLELTFFMDENPEFAEFPIVDFLDDQQNL